jgi:predicted DsbA family dithiol-disulfide isomerase
MRIAIYSDVICPWCWIGKRRLELALRALPEISAEIAWQPFQLNPAMPPGGMARADYRRRKFGSDGYAKALDARVTAVARELGLAMELAAQPRTPNTALAHRLIWLAGRRGVQDGVVEALFSAYFSEGLDVGDREALIQLAARHGIAIEESRSFFAGVEGQAEVAAAEQGIRHSGMDGVPLYLIDGRSRITGAQPVEAFVAALSSHASSSAEDARDPLGG